MGFLGQTALNVNRQTLVVRHFVIRQHVTGVGGQAFWEDSPRSDVRWRTVRPFILAPNNWRRRLARDRFMTGVGEQADSIAGSAMRHYAVARGYHFFCKCSHRGGGSGIQPYSLTCSSYGMMRQF